ncbi:M1 family metallopeptidase [Moorellaceae bacterium AZ2]
MQRKKLLLLALPGLFLAFWSCGLQNALLSSPQEDGQILARYGQVVLDPPPLKVEGEILLPAGYLSLAGRGDSPAAEGEYLPLGAALEALGLSSFGADPQEVKLPVRDGGKTGHSHYRFYPVYNIQARLDPAEGLVQGKLFLAYQNPYFYPLTELQFNLPANGMPDAGNSLAVHHVMVNKIEAAFTVRGTRLEVPLSRPLLSRQTLMVEIDFSTRVPVNKPARLGIFDGVMMVSGWYPLLAPRQEGAWQGVAEGAGFGDPYFADAAYYRVDLRVPSDLVVVASGRVTGRMERSGWSDWSFSSEHPIREFAFAAATGWQFSSRQVGPVELVLAARSRPSPEILDTAARALVHFQGYWGTYPFSYLHLVEVPLEGLAGMEYPGLIFLSTLNRYGPPVVVHEVAHQWWYNLVGNDSIRAAWIDEGLAEYSTLLYYSAADPGYYRRRKEEIVAEAGNAFMPPDKPLTAYPSQEDYRRAVYRQGVLYWLRWEEKMGRPALRDALRYVQEYYRFERVRVEALGRILEFYSDPQKHLAY